MVICTPPATPNETPRLIAWGERQPLVRAMLLTSTRAVPGATVDALSDYDVILIVSDARPFAEDRAWITDFGRPLVVYWDPVETTPEGTLEWTSNVVQYADGLKIDFTVWSVSWFQRIATAPNLDPELDAGYRVLLDKDGLTAALPAPTYAAYVPVQPTEQEFRAFVEEFFSDVPYVAKCLQRDELLPAKWCLDHDMKHVYLRRLLEWRVGIDTGWSVPVGAHGKGLKKHLPTDIWTALEATYAGAGIEENWEALFNTIALFRRVAFEVAAALGYAYPIELDREVTAYSFPPARRSRFVRALSRLPDRSA